MIRTTVLAGMACLLVLGGATPVEAKDDVQVIRRVLASNQDPQVRIAQIPKLVALGSEHAATLLGWLVEHDATLAVRIGAAQGLGRVGSENAIPLLLGLIPRGGPRALRAALADSLGRTRGGGVRAARALGMAHRTTLERALLVDALAGCKDAGTRAWLAQHVGDADPTLRYAAVRALARRKDAVGERSARLGRLLVETEDVERLRELLDVLDAVIHRTMLPALQRLRAHPFRDVAETAGVLLGHVPDPAPLPPAPVKPPPKPGDRYAKPRPPFRPTLEVPPTPPPKGRREDLVVAFDATGSAHLLLPLVTDWTLRELDRFESSGISARVGVVLFRGAKGRASRIEVLPLTFDLQRVRAFLAEADPGGTDDRGAAVAEGLRQALDLMNWRWTAARRLRLFADSGTDDPRLSLRRVKDHHDADGTRTAVAYFLRTRTRIPDDLEALARAGGTHEVVPLEWVPPRHR